MVKKSAFIVIIAFVVGVMSTLLISSAYIPNTPAVSTTTSYVVANADTVKAQSNDQFITKILGLTNEELPSPHNWIKESQISVEGNQVVIKIDNAQWSRFTDTNSMDPVIDKGANAIQIIPKDEAQIHVGDIVSYESDYSDGVIIHRVVEIGYDKNGWYCIMKGDNNSRIDPGKVRFKQIKRITIAVIY